MGNQLGDSALFDFAQSDNAEVERTKQHKRTGAYAFSPRREQPKM